MISKNICLCLLLTSTFAIAMDDSHRLLLSMKYYRNNKVIREVNFYGTEIDPNIAYNKFGQFKLTIDGIEVDILNDATYWRLNKLRRSFSYDTFTQGVERLEPVEAICNLEGPSMGITLEARYLTYQNDTIVYDEMIPVYDWALNCLYQRSYRPTSENSRESARGAMETLRTIDELTSLDNS